MITAYPIKSKAKSVEICRAFIEGCGGNIAVDVDKLLPGEPFFYGLNNSNIHLWKQLKREPSRTYYYCDNSYFDKSRQEYFRVTKNRLQHTGFGISDGRRFKELGIEIKPWKDNGEYIVVCPQSDFFMRDVVGFGFGLEVDWVAETSAWLRMLTDIPIKLRPWDRDKTALSATLQDDLAKAYALITWSSAAAIGALLEGVPVVASEQCAIADFGGLINAIENLPRKEGRENWAGVLADNQWTLNEFKNGTVWKALQ